MNVVTAIKDSAALGSNSARIGLIIPSVNTYSEPQFTHFAPAGLGIHVARARVAGEWKRPLPEMAGEIATAAKLLVRLPSGHDRVPLHRHVDDAGAAGRRPHPRHRAARRPASRRWRPASWCARRSRCSASSNMILLTPYKSNKAVIDYLTASGFTVVRDVAMNLEAKDFGSVTPAQWAQMAKELDGPDVDGVFLSCTNTTQIEAIADIERELGKPVVNSNQAVLWGCVKRLKKTLSPLKPMPELGRLMGHLD